MMQMNHPGTGDDRALVAFFAKAGLSVEIVDSCDCDRCRRGLRPAA